MLCYNCLNEFSEYNEDDYRLEIEEEIIYIICKKCNSVVCLKYNANNEKEHEIYKD